LRNFDREIIQEKPIWEAGIPTVKEFMSLVVESIIIGKITWSSSQNFNIEYVNYLEIR
jgi:Tol biopolymer transport system component